MPKAKPPEIVWDDRADAAHDRLGTLENDYGIDKDDILVYISGGGNFDGKSEAERIREHLKQSGHPLSEEQRELNTTEQSSDTASNVDEIYEVARKNRADRIHPVTSKDHVARIMAGYLFHEERNENIGIIPKGSMETYTTSGEPPVIGEMGEYRQILKAIDATMWQIPEEKRKRAAEDLRQTLKQYSQ